MTPADHDVTATATPVLSTLSFRSPLLHAALDDCSDDTLDACSFGVIGFDAEGIVQRYNAYESHAAGLLPPRVLGHALFTAVAPCMNNFMVAQRFEDAQAAGALLDTTLDYTLTLRMRPVKVRLRLLSAPASGTRYVLVLRSV